MGLRYRLKQFWLATTAGALSPAMREDVAACLGAAQYDLFCQFQDSEQWHSWHVYQTLREIGITDPQLLTAALLHDIGKVREPLAAWERAIIVLGEKLWPEQAARWGEAAGLGWQRSFVVRSRHPDWGAEMAQQAGAAPDVVTLIRYHQAPCLPDQQRHLAEQMRLLQWADDRN